MNARGLKRPTDGNTFKENAFEANGGQTCSRKTAEEEAMPCAAR